MEKSEKVPLDDDFVGFLRYEGELVQGGVIDANSASVALRGIDRALRHFVLDQRPELADGPFRVPVATRPGSWTAWIPSNVQEWLMAGGGAAFTTYVLTAAKKMAEHDFEDVGLLDSWKGAVRRALAAMQWFVKIGKHVGNVTMKKFRNLRFTENNEMVGIPNELGQFLYVPKDYFLMYLDTPPAVMSDVVDIVSEGRALTIGRIDGADLEEVKVSLSDKDIFVFDEDSETKVLFPELVHGQAVQLEGVVTKGNETANTIGFRYRDHILLCQPRVGSIVRFKPHLFLRCSIAGHISRLGDRGKPDEPRPKILFDDLKKLEEDGEFEL